MAHEKWLCAPGPSSESAASRGGCRCSRPRAEHHRQHPAADVADARVREVEPRAARVAEAAQRRPLRADLQEPSEERAERHRHRGVLAVGREHRRKAEGGEEEGHVQEPGREGCDGEPPLGVERGHAERGRPHEEDVREDHAVMPAVRSNSTGLAS